MTEKHNSDSEVQRSIEQIVINKLSKYNIQKNPEENPNYQLDLYGNLDGEIVIGEIYAGVDKLNSAQKKKIITDCFKLIYIEKYLSEKSYKDIKPKVKFKKIMVFVDDKIKDIFTTEQDKSNSWIKDALKMFEVDLIKIDLSEAYINLLRDAKLKQRNGMTTFSTKK